MGREAATGAAWRVLLAAVERGEDPIPLGGLTQVPEARKEEDRL